MNQDLGVVALAWSAGDHDPVAVVKMYSYRESYGKMAEIGPAEVDVTRAEASFFGNSHERATRDLLVSDRIIMQQALDSKIDAVMSGDGNQTLQRRVRMAALAQGRGPEQPGPRVYD